MPVDKMKDVGLVFGDWTILETLGKGKVLCRCSCGTERVLYKKSLVSGVTKSCGCKRKENFRKSAIDDLTGARFGAWVVTKELGNGYVECRCDCGTIRKIHKPSLKSGATTSCGCLSRAKAASTNIENHSLVGETFNDLTIIEELGGGLVKCRCSCGNEYIGRKQSIKSGHTKSCGCKTYSFDYRARDRVGEKYGEWEIIEELGNNRVRCRCSCGTERVLRKDIIVQGKSKSCGCKSTEMSRQTMLEKYGELSIHKVDSPREAWQIETLHSRDAFMEFIKNNYIVKPTIWNLSEDLSVREGVIKTALCKYDLFDYVSIEELRSDRERELSAYIEELATKAGCEVINNDRRVLSKSRSELDIYIPKLNLAFEFNGSYWHCDEFKPELYHQNKTIECLKQGIRLIHIFEYEWVNPSERDKLKGWIQKLILGGEVIDISKCNLIKLTELQFNDFIKKNFIGTVKKTRQNSVLAGVIHNSEVVAVVELYFIDSVNLKINQLCLKLGNEIPGLISFLLNKIQNLKAKRVFIDIEASKFTGNNFRNFKVINSCISMPFVLIVLAKENEIICREMNKNQLFSGEACKYINQSTAIYKIYDSGDIKLEIEV